MPRAVIGAVRNLSQKKGNGHAKQAAEKNLKRRVTQYFFHFTVGGGVAVDQFPQFVEGLGVFARFQTDPHRIVHDDHSKNDGNSKHRRETHH